MKTILLTALIALSSASSFAMIGDLYEAIIEKFGEPDEFDRSERRAYWENHEDGYTITIYFDSSNSSIFEVYTSMVDGVSGQSTFRRAALLEKFGAEIPNLKYEAMQTGRTRNFGTMRLSATPDCQVQISPITHLGRIAIVNHRESRFAGAQILIFRENGARNLNQMFDRRAQK